MRQTDRLWQYCLSRIRTGDLDETVRKALLGRVGATVGADGITPTRLYPLNADVERVNYGELNALEDSDVLEFEAELRVYDRKRPFLEERMVKDCSAPKTLHLVKGCQVILLCNLCPEEGLVNGSRGVVTGFECDLPVVRFLNGRTRILDYYTWELEERDLRLASMEQIPLRLGYAFSIHRAQGLSLDCVEADLSSVFEYGQAYVALSRVRSLEGLSLVALDFDKIRAHPFAVEYYTGLAASSPAHPS